MNGEQVIRQGSRPNSGGHNRPNSGGQGRPNSGGHVRPNSGGHGRPGSGGHGRPGSGGQPLEDEQLKHVKGIFINIENKLYLFFFLSNLKSYYD